MSYCLFYGGSFNVRSRGPTLTRFLQSNATDWPHIHNLQIKYGEVWELIWEEADNVSSILNQILNCQIISDTIIVDINIVKSIVRWADRRRRQVL